MYKEMDFGIRKNGLRVLVALVFLSQLTVVKAASNEQVNDRKVSKTTVAANTNSDSGSSLSVDDINDLGYALQRIRQQAINIYVEATRLKGGAETSAQIPNLTTVPQELPKDQTKFLPFRRPWLVYFVTTLEPLVHLLKEDVKEVETGTRTIDVTAEQRKALDPFIKEWSQGVARLDEDLKRSSEFIEDAEKNNVALAKLASDLDKEVGKLEQVREKAFDVIESMKESEKKASSKN